VVVVLQCYDTLTVIVNNVYLFYVSFASVDLDLGLDGLVLVFLASRESWSWSLHCCLDYKTAFQGRIRRLWLMGEGDSKARKAET